MSAARRSTVSSSAPCVSASTIRPMMQRPEYRREGGQTHDDDPEGDPDLVLSEVVKECGARGGH